MRFIPWLMKNIKRHIDERDPMEEQVLSLGVNRNIVRSIRAETAITLQSLEKVLDNIDDTLVFINADKFLKELNEVADTMIGMSDELEPLYVKDVAPEILRVIKKFESATYRKEEY